MKKFLIFTLLFLTLLSCLPLQAAAAENEITVYNWGQNISDGTDGSLDVIAEFEARTGIKVNYLTFDSNESLYTKLKTGGSTYDVIIPSDYMIGRLINEDMLEPIDLENVPNFKNVDDIYKYRPYDPENLYSVPYTVGTVGVIYNTKYVDEADIGSWNLLWNSKYAGKILMFDNCRDAFAIAESLLGYSLNTTDPQELRNCANKLTEQKPILQGYVMDQIYAKMTREEAWIAPYYAGDYLYMVEENPDLAFYFPEEGFNAFIDAACIPKGCGNKAGAEAFINFLCDPEICAANLDYICYTAPISAAKAYMDPDLASSDVAYPTEETLSNSESFLALPIETSQLMDSLWLSVKTSGNDMTKYLIAGAVLVSAAIGLTVYAKVRRRQRLARRGISRRINDHT
ncbi:MAG: ABC transporter substrate-binding protein [Oscillospiraceae bacterium]|nr:ABC transporter substrate-binding protein [Oscillospiraceae bacterium]